MISPSVNYVQYSGGWEIRRRHTISTGTGVQYKPGTLSIRRRHIISTDTGVQHGGGSTVQAYMFITDAELPGDPKKYSCLTHH